MLREKLHGGIIGLAVGDALGVPVEFKRRAYLDAKPVVGMLSYGTHNQPIGTWSDDSSLAFCLMESIIHSDLNLNDLCERFLRWLRDGYWTPHGKVFDRGIATTKAIMRFENNVRPTMCGGFGEWDNGNGSLMRILPLVYYLKNKPIEERIEAVRNVGSTTHAHFRSVFACLIYVEYALLLLTGMERFEAYQLLKRNMRQVVSYNDFNPKEVSHFDRILKGNVHELKRSEIKSEGYVVYTLEAAMWSFLTTDSYKDAVLQAVNLGEDTDTTGAVAGGIAGLYYGFSGIPSEWKHLLVKIEEITELCDSFECKIELKEKR